MGLKQHVHSKIAQSLALTPIVDMWEGPGIIVVDGTNFLIRILDHPQFRTRSIFTPRLLDFQASLHLLLSSLLQACRGAELHFLLDGVDVVKDNNAKDAEHDKRARQRLVENAAHVYAIQQNGSCRGTILNMQVLIQILVLALQELPGSHTVCRTHAARGDNDIAVAAYAESCGASMLISDDSDFFLLFGGVVLLGGSLVLDAGDLPCRRCLGRTTTLTHRLAALQLDSRDEFYVLAFLAGSDFHPPVVEAPLPELAVLARQELSQAGDWRGAVRKIDASNAPAFLNAFDPVLRPAWGTTAIHPPGELDAVLATLVGEGEGLAPERLVRAYSQMHLSSGALYLACFGEASEGVCPADLVPGRPAALARRRSFARLATLLGRAPSIVPDSWDDEDDEGEAAAGATIQRVREEFFALAQHAVAGHFAEAADSIGTLKPLLMTEPLAEDIPDWVHEGMQGGVPRARSVFYIVTGIDLQSLPAEQGNLVRACVTTQSNHSQQIGFLALVAAHVGRSTLVAEQMRDICSPLAVPVNIPSLVEGENHVYGAILLGQLLWTLPSLIQDAFCLLGGDGPLFAKLRLHRAKAVCSEGRVHKAKHGYRVNIRVPSYSFDVALQCCDLTVVAIEDYPGHIALITTTVPFAGYVLRKVDFEAVEDLTTAKRKLKPLRAGTAVVSLRGPRYEFSGGEWAAPQVPSPVLSRARIEMEAVPGAVVERLRGDGFRLTHIRAEDAFALEQSLLQHDGRPYVLTVKALDSARGGSHRVERVASATDKVLDDASQFGYS